MLVSLVRGSALPETSQQMQLGGVKHLVDRQAHVGASRPQIVVNEELRTCWQVQTRWRVKH